MYSCDLKRMKSKISTFAKFGDAGRGGVARHSLSSEAHLARDEFIRRMRAIGAVIETDDLANVYATLPGADASLKRIVMASHADSVMNGRNYDGILGVMGAMEVLETVAAQGIPHRHPLTAMIWTNEEGSPYPPAMMSSGDARAASPYKGDEKNRLSPAKCAAMFELHIEQGPILEAAKKDIGVVTCGLGMVSYRIRTRGQDEQAGAAPTGCRKDALFAAAQALVYLHERLDALDKELAYTTGAIACRPCAHAVIPDEVEFSLDARHEDPEVLRQAIKAIEGLPKEFAGCATSFERAWERDTAYFDKRLVGFVKEAADGLGMSNQFIESDAGHDAQSVSCLIPTTMVFVPSKGGRSHCEPEYTAPDQCLAGASVMLNAALKADAALDQGE